MDLEQRVVVVTGGGSGIGEALARAAREAGAAHVAVADLDGDQAERVASEVGGAAHQIDVRDEAAIVRMVEQTESVHGPIGLCASNAGYVTTGGLDDTNDRDELVFQCAKREMDEEGSRSSQVRRAWARRGSFWS